MKHFNITILLTLLMSMVGARTLAYNAYIDGIYYSFSGTNATVTCYSIVASSNNDAYFGDIVIPETVVWNETMYTVTAIGADAFRCCRNLRSVNIPSSVTSIGNAAFRECSGLTSVNIPSSVTSIGEYVFYNCSSLSSINIPSGVTSIGEYVFYNCSSLSSINIPSGVTSIGYDAFKGCSGITSIYIPSSVTSIGSSAFYGCDGLTSITVEEGNPNYDSRNNCNAIIEKASNTLLWGCQNTIIPSSVTYIGYGAFAECSGLTSITIPSGVTSIGSYAFSSCSSLTSINIPSGVTYIGEAAFQDCVSLNSISIPIGVTSIGQSMFSGCSSLTSISVLGDVTFIGNDVFAGCAARLTLSATTPAILGNYNSIGAQMIIRVPDAALTTYRTADGWSSFANRIVGYSTNLDYEVEVNVDNSRSALHEVIGEENLPNVVSLKVTGDINGYDIMVLRNKMDNLHYLDLSDANIVANPYEYVTGQHTEDNVFPAKSFQNLTKLISIKLPNSVTEIGGNAFYGCSNLNEVEFQTGLQNIGESAFENCSNLKVVDIPEGLNYIGAQAFRNCGNLKTLNLREGLWYIGARAFGGTSGNKIEELVIPYGVVVIWDGAFNTNNRLKQIAFPSTLKTLGRGVFQGCSELENISLPTSLESIPQNTFSGCSSLTRVDIPSTITSIGDQAFRGCTSLTDVYTYIVEPTPIEMNTFNNYTTATLHVPSTSYYNYWYDTQWSQFRAVEEFMAEYQYFYINNDFTIGDEKGTISAGFGQDDPDADLNGGSGLIVESSTNNKQYLDEMHIKAWGEDCASVITANNLEAEKVYFDIEITANRWYFLAFPFDVKKTNITAPGKDYVFRVYSAEERAQGNSGWQNWTADMLEKGQGYIFKCSKGGTLSLCVEKNQSETPAMSWAAENRPLTLTSAPAEDEQDASWNFLGNPQTSYYDIDKTGYTQPITVWNGSGYEAVRAEDDAYALKPFEAFFVQKPTSTSEMEFPADGRYTQTQWEQELLVKAEARRTEGVKIDRQLVNLVLTDGQEKDKTRVVFNEKASKDYEIDCDAAKFMSSERVPQLYTIDQRKTRYAINERPTGEVRLGYKAINKGEMTIMAVRMDQPVMLRDTKLQITHDLSVGDYTFTTEAGTNEDRFVLVVDNSATNVGKLRQETGVSVMAEEGGISFLGISEEPVNVYSIGGVLMAGNVSNGFLSLPKATYLVKVGTETAKVIVR